jgi:hypothetical protein
VVQWITKLEAWILPELSLWNPKKEMDIWNSLKDETLPLHGGSIRL